MLGLLSVGLQLCVRVCGSAHGCRDLWCSIDFPVELESVCVSCPVRVLGTKPESCVRIEHTDSLNHLYSPLFLFLMGALELLFQWAVCVKSQIRGPSLHLKSGP